MRLAGLYALERLAQSIPSQRQTIVNLWCAYLRMADTPISHMGDGNSWEAQPDIDDLGREEREVRLTVQRLLAAHLRPGEDPGRHLSTYWPEVGVLDLTSAHLQDFDVALCRLPTSTTFYGASFIGEAMFNSADFTGTSYFNGASFTGDAWFDHASFTSAAFFTSVSFTKLASFNEASFRSDAWFGEATFTDEAWFRDATFSGTVMFDGASFSRTVWFRNASLNGPAFFEAVSFASSARFHGATFSGAAWFLPATGSASFVDARAYALNHLWPDGWVLSAEADNQGYHKLVPAEQNDLLEHGGTP